MNETQSTQMEERAKLLEQLDQLKQQQPELEDILQKFYIDTEEYDRTMLMLLYAQSKTYPSTANSLEDAYA